MLSWCRGSTLHTTINRCHKSMHANYWKINAVFELMFSYTSRILAFIQPYCGDKLQNVDSFRTKGHFSKMWLMSTIVKACTLHHCVTHLVLERKPKIDHENKSYLSNLITVKFHPLQETVTAPEVQRMLVCKSNKGVHISNAWPPYCVCTVVCTLQPHTALLFAECWVLIMLIWDHFSEYNLVPKIEQKNSQKWKRSQKLVKNSNIIL